MYVHINAGIRSVELSPVHLDVSARLPQLRATLRVAADC